MSTHTLYLAEDVCDRIGIIHNGSLIASGDPEELRNSRQGGRQRAGKRVPDVDTGEKKRMNAVATLLRPRWLAFQKAE